MIMSDILKLVYKIVSGLKKFGVIDKMIMCKFDVLCFINVYEFIFE